MTPAVRRWWRQYQADLSRLSAVGTLHQRLPGELRWVANHRVRGIRSWLRYLEWRGLGIERVEVWWEAIGTAEDAVRLLVSGRAQYSLVIGVGAGRRLP